MLIIADQPDCETFWEAPCPYCALWIGPHKHLRRSTGEVGTLVTRCSPVEIALQEALRRMIEGE